MPQDFAPFAMKSFFSNLCLLLCMLVLPAAYAQHDGYLEFSGKTVKKASPFEGAKVTVFKGSTRVGELTTPKNGKFSFDLELGVDYKVTFSAPGCVDMFMFIYASKCAADKVIFPIYDIEVNFFEYGQSSIDYAHFAKNPITKVIFDGNKSFRDDEQYVTGFLKGIYITPDELQKREDEQLAKDKAEKERLAALAKAEKDKQAAEAAANAEKHRLELLQKQKAEEEERIRLEQIAAAEKKARDEAEALARLMKEKNKLEKKNENKGVVTKKEKESNQSLVKEEVKLTIEKEQKKLKEKQNRAIKASYESDLLKQVAENERLSKEGNMKKLKEKAEANEVIEILSQEAMVKAKSHETRQQLKLKNKQSVLNSRIINQELTALIKVVAYNDLSVKTEQHKTYPLVKNYKPRTMIGITTDTEVQQVKTIYTINVFEVETKTVYKKEKYSWGLVYYYRNNQEITETEYYNAIAPYNIPL